jgi:hypothetical protein
MLACSNALGNYAADVHSRFSFSIVILQSALLQVCRAETMRIPYLWLDLREVYLKSIPPDYRTTRYKSSPSICNEITIAYHL